VLDITKGLWFQAVLFFVYSFMSIWGWFTWKRKGIPILKGGEINERNCGAT
jgi:hypothetical protein